MTTFHTSPMRLRRAAAAVAAVATAAWLLLAAVHGAESLEPPPLPGSDEAAPATQAGTNDVPAPKPAEPTANHGGDDESECPDDTCHEDGHGCAYLDWNCPPNMPPHTPYYPELHGYYYFRPYHYSHICLHRRIVTTWGGDPRNPYSNGVFERVYAATSAKQVTAPNHKEMPKAPESLAEPKAPQVLPIPLDPDAKETPAEQ